MTRLRFKEDLLTVVRHDRDVAQLTYVYPVVSRRAGGVSVGVNLNPNHACNWRCIYCQVPGLVRGRGPAIDLALLRAELEQMLSSIVSGAFMERHVPAGARRLNDVALSGDGEPTTSGQFASAVAVVREALGRCGLAGKVKVVLISNGSMLHRPAVAAGLRQIAELGGELWFKLDSATPGGMRRINQTSVAPRVHLERLRAAARLVPTWLQTCVFSTDGEPPSSHEQEQYTACLGRLAADRVPLRGVLLYNLARPSRQPEGSRLAPLPGVWLDQFAAQIRRAGFVVRVSK